MKLFLNAEDTPLWAIRRGAGWPCSTLSGKTLFAEFVDGDLVDYAIDGKTNDDINMDVNEFNAITRDFLATRNNSRADVWRLGAGPYVDHTILRNDDEVGHIHVTRTTAYEVYWVKNCAMNSERADTYEECIDIVKTSLESK